MYSQSQRTGPRIDRALLRSIQKCFSARFNQQLDDMQLVIWARIASGLPDLITAFDITARWKDRQKPRAISLDEIIRYASKVIITNAQQEMCSIRLKAPKRVTSTLAVPNEPHNQRCNVPL